MSKNASRVTSMLAAVALVPVLSGCGGDDSSSAEAPEAAPNTDPVSAVDVTADVLSQAGGDVRIIRLMESVESATGMTCGDPSEVGIYAKPIDYVSCESGDRMVRLHVHDDPEHAAEEIEDADKADRKFENRIDALGASNWYIQGDYNSDYSEELNAIQREVGGVRFTFGE